MAKIEKQVAEMSAQELVALVSNAQDGDQEALSKILKGNQAIFIEETGIYGNPAKAQVVPLSKRK